MFVFPSSPDLLLNFCQMWNCTKNCLKLNLFKCPQLHDIFTAMSVSGHLCKKAFSKGKCRLLSGNCIVMLKPCLLFRTTLCHQKSSHWIADNGKGCFALTMERDFLQQQKTWKFEILRLLLKVYCLYQRYVGDIYWKFVLLQKWI